MCILLKYLNQFGDKIMRDFQLLAKGAFEFCKQRSRNNQLVRHEDLS